MQFPISVFQGRFSKQKFDFIENGHKYYDEKLVQSKFLRIWSDCLYSVGRLYIAAEIDWETVELTEIYDVAGYFQNLKNQHQHIFDTVKKNPEMMEMFREKFGN